MATKRIALFPGTFDPFTLGHFSVVGRALDIVDEMVIAIGINDSKVSYFPVQKRIEMMQQLYRGEPRVRIGSYDCLTVDYAKELGARYIVRGIRSVIDFEYEKTIADMNRKMSGVETIVLFTEPHLTHISSTVVRELLRYGHDVSDFVPQGLPLEI
jgi:pantetheine-phosphate adenylyltransferase